MNSELMTLLLEGTRSLRKESLDKKLLIEKLRDRRRDLNFLKKPFRNSKMITKMKMLES